MQTISAKTVILKDVSGNYLLPYVEPTPLVTTISDGLMSKEDKIKLDSMSEGGSGTGGAKNPGEYRFNIVSEATTVPVIMKVSNIIRIS